MKPNDVVMINSGGPEMVVQSISESGDVTVGWHDGDEHKIATFPAACLTFKSRLMIC